ncbi:LysE family translocator [Aeromicrobium sp. UC242_57]|uniref:LysE family translocator n=1 Tax=Aeromicrobium sp. UC242_57 TaxID=3374624 RepID=UPI0037AA43D7
MITVEQLLTFGLAAFILIAIPGPSVVFVIGRALAYGRGVALMTVLGNTLGLLAIVVLVAMGLGAIVQESIVVFMILKFVGAAYLIWLGVQAIRHRSAFSVADAGEGAAPLLSRRTVVRQGFIVGFSNPKAFMIIGALLPQFVVRGRWSDPAADAAAGARRRRHRLAVGLAVGGHREPAAVMVQRVPAPRRRDGRRRRDVDDRSRRRPRRHRQLPLTPSPSPRGR